MIQAKFVDSDLTWKWFWIQKKFIAYANVEILWSGALLWPNHSLTNRHHKMLIDLFIIRKGKKVQLENKELKWICFQPGFRKYDLETEVCYRLFDFQ